MATILIVEDDEFKQRRIEQVARDTIPEANIVLERAVNSALSRIEKDRPDIILLDMSLTTFAVGPGEPGGRPQNFGGIEILRQMQRKGLVVPVIVITQHERFAKGSQEVHLSTVRRELTEQHSSVFRGLIYYNSAVGDWEKLLRSQLRKTLSAGKDLNANTGTGRRRRPGKK
jgi:CheY-like chemotaxis protein